MTRKQEIKRLKEIADNPQNYGEQFAKDAMEKLANIQAGKDILKQEFAAKKNITTDFKQKVKYESERLKNTGHEWMSLKMRTNIAREKVRDEYKKIADERIQGFLSTLSLNEIVEAARQDLVEKTGFNPEVIEEKKD